MDSTTDIFKYQGKRLQTEKLVDSFLRIGMPRKALALADCGTYLGFFMDDSGTNLVEANFCRVRLCPMCDWRRSLKIFSATSRVMDFIDANHQGIQYLFLTLTVRNVSGDCLSDCIDSMMAAFNRMASGRDWKKRVLGAMRTLEITYNSAEDDFHPHFHLILAVGRDYGKRGNDLYWDHNQWACIWQRALRADYQPLVYIERVKGGRHQGIAEVSKYAVKSYDFLKLKDDVMIDRVLSIFVHALHGRRLCSYTGVFRKALQQLAIADPEDGELVDTFRLDIATAIVKYRWHAGIGNYIRIDRR